MSPMEVLKSSKLCAGTNYLIADGVVYEVTVWLFGGIAGEHIWTHDDPDYMFHYSLACHNPNTLYKKRTETAGVDPLEGK